MKKIDLFLFTLAALALMSMLSSCSAIPTLPPLESTIIIEGPGSGGTKTAAAPTGEAKETAAAVTVTTVLEPTPKNSTATAAVPDTATAVPTRAPTKTVVPTRTAQPTKSPSATLAPTEEPTSTTAPTASPVPTGTFTPTPVEYDFTVQQGSPTYQENFAHPALGCEWLGLAGQVFDAQGEVVKQLVVRVEGELNGQPPIDGLDMTGSHTDYGPGGYELELSLEPVDSSGALSLQLFSLDGRPLSAPVQITTYSSCDQNLILLNFQEK